MAGAHGRGNARVALICAAVFVAMVGAAFAAVPFYRAFCQATGFNGAVKRAVPGASDAISDRMITVRFDTNVRRGLPWKFEPEQASQRVHLGENKLAFFRATNVGDKAVTGRALYNVLPESAGPIFLEAGVFLLQEPDPETG